jgi:antitoxin (DNA-binding transcriptional repressor) of toxin-antitoxin stability system
MPNEPEMVTRNGKPVAVILPVKDCKAFLNRADADDARWLKRRREKPMSFRPLDSFLAKRTAPSK